MNDHSAGYQRRTSALVVLSSITTAVLLFAVFRLSAEYVSVEWIGAWSLIQGMLLIARISDSGAGNNISRVIAVRFKQSAPLQLRNTTIASLLIASGPSIILTTATAPLVGWYVVNRFGADLDRESIWLLVWIAAFNAAMAASANVLLAICEGAFQLNYKSCSIIAGNIVGMLLIYPLLTGLGPAGIGLVYLASTATQLGLSTIRVAQLWRNEQRGEQMGVASHIRYLWRENFHLSGIALIRLSFEPATKSLLSLFAPLIVIAQFELALRVTTQIRIVIQSALQPLLVIGARDEGDAHIDTREAFLRNDRVLAMLSLGGVVSQTLSAPAIQWLGMGFNHRIFIVFFAFLAVGNALNTMGLSGYYWQLTSGSLVSLVKIQSIMAIANVFVGSVGYLLRSEVLVVAAYSAAFAFGGLASRSFLPGVRLSQKILVPALVVGAGSSASAFVIALHPQSFAATGAFLASGGVVAVGCLYIVYKSFWRRSI